MSLPPKEIPLGAMRFNSESQKLEYWMGSAWMQIQTFSPTLDGGVRGIWSGGNAANPSNVIHADIEYITISTQGNTIDFGSDISEGKRRCSGFGSRTRGFIAAGRTPSNRSTIDFVTFSSTGTTTAWGDNLTSTGTADNAGFANSTRGISKSGYTSPGSTGTLDFITMSSTGGVNDFGDLIASGDAGGSFASPTRGILGGGYTPSSTDVIDYIQFATQGTAVDFGDFSVRSGGKGGSASNGHGGL